MSDQVDEAAPAEPEAPAPQVTLVARNEGGYVGLMHLGDTVRHFIANDIAHARKMIASCGISEFSMDQEGADAIAESAIQAHADQAVAGLECVAEPAPEPAPEPEPASEPPLLAAPADVAPEQSIDEGAEAEAQSAAEPVADDEAEPKDG